MKRFIFLLAFFPMFVSAQKNRIGGRIAYTHTNKSYNFGFGGVSFNTDPDYFAGVTQPTQEPILEPIILN